MKRPFQLILPHFLTGLTQEEFHHCKISFAKANHTRSASEDSIIKYEFNPCNSELRFASSGTKGYAVLESDHCCFLCIQKDRKPESVRDTGYCLTRVERLAPDRNEVYFVATYFIGTCIEVIIPL